jgi:hypothetical protein
MLHILSTAPRLLSLVYNTCFLLSLSVRVFMVCLNTKCPVPGPSGSIDVEPCLSVAGATQTDGPFGRMVSKDVKGLTLRLSFVWS